MKILEHKNAKYILIACLCVCVVTALAVMLLRPEDPNAKNNISEVSRGDLTGTHLYKAYSDSFTADAEVTTDYNDRAEVVYADYKSYDEKTLLSLFFKGENPVRTNREGDVYSYNVSYTESSECISIFKQGAYYQAPDWQYYAYPTDGFAAKYEEYYSILPLYSETYKQESLSFMSREEAIKKAKEILTKLNLDVTDDIDVYAIDCATMQAYQDEKLKEDPYARENYSIKDTFTEDDEFYMLYFHTIYDGVPVTRDSYDMWDEDRLMNGTVIEMVISKKGIIKFSATAAYEVQGTAETSDSLITAEDAVDKVFDIYSSIVTDEKVTVKEVNFEYTPIAYNDNLLEVKLTPAWTVVLSSDVGETKGVITHRHINAVTGEEIK